MPQSRRGGRQAGQGASEPSTPPVRASRSRGGRREKLAGGQQRLAVSESPVVPETHLPVVEPRVPSPKPRGGLPVPEPRLRVSVPRLPEPRIPSRPNRRDFVPELEEDMSEVPELDAHAAAGKASRGGDREHSDRRANAKSRVEAKEARMDKEREEHVRKYGEEEARRRQHEEWRHRKEMRKPNTLSAEEMAREEREANPLITVAVQYRVDKKVRWQTNISERPLDEFDISETERHLDKFNETQHGTEQGWHTTSILVSIKSRHSRAVRKQQTMDDLSLIQWASIVDLIIAEGREWKPQLAVMIKISADADKNMVKAFKKASGAAGSKRSRDQLSDNESSTAAPNPPRRMRTQKLLDQAVVRAMAGEDVMRFHKRLTDRWLCSDERCINCKGWCFVDGGGDHFSMDAKQHVRWAKAIMQGDPHVSVEQPPQTLYLHWTQVQGPVTASSKKSKLQTQRERK